jgi:hypothetical protein
VTTQQARVVIRREGGFWRDSIRRYKVRLDGERIGMLRPDEELSIEVEPGSHEVQIKLDWGSSPKRIAELRPARLPGCAAVRDPCWDSWFPIATSYWGATTAPLD